MFANTEHDLSAFDAEARDAAAATFRMLADASRLAVLWHLRDGELPSGELARRIGRPAPTVSQHLAKLRLAGLVLTRREGTTIHYRLANDHVQRLVQDVVAHVQHLEESR